MHSRLLVICREGWMFALVLGFVLAAAVLRQINLLILLWSLLAGAFLVSLRLLRITLTGLEPRRILPGPISAGDWLAVRIEVRNPRRRVGAWAVAAEDAIERLGADHGQPLRAAAMLAHVPAGQTRQAGYRVRLTQRGKYRFGPLRLSTRFPFGLLRRTLSLPECDELLVLPRLGRLARGWLRRQPAATASVGQGRRRQAVLEGDFYGLREWRADDSRRHIHWRTSARRQTLVVRQFEDQRQQDVALVVDLWQPPRPGPGELDNVELAVSFAATVASDLCRRGGELRLATAGAVCRTLSGPASPALLREVMECLALAEAGPQDGLATVLCGVLAAARPSTRLVLVSTRSLDPSALGPAGPAAEGWRNDARIQGALIIDCSRDTLAEYFDPAAD